MQHQSATYLRWRATTRRTVGALARRVGVLPRRPAVLMYHRVATEPVDPWGLAVSSTRFEEHLRWLGRHRIVMPLPEFARRHRAGRLPGRAVAITFDDGYACNATTAAPLLVRHGLPATIFVTSGPVNSGHEYWWDDLQRIVFDAPGDRLELVADDRHVSVPLGARDDPATPWASGHDATTPRQQAFIRLWDELRSLGPGAQADALADLRAQAGSDVPPRPSHRPMTPDEVWAVSATGLIAIGTHTITHPALTTWPAEIQRSEIDGGRDACAAIVGRTPTAFAYPYGDHDPTTVALVRELGFDVACTTVSAAVTPAADPMAMPRVQVENWSARRLARVLRTL